MKFDSSRLNETKTYLDVFGITRRSNGNWKNSETSMYLPDLYLWVSKKVKSFVSHQIPEVLYLTHLSLCLFCCFRSCCTLLCMLFVIWGSDYLLFGDSRDGYFIRDFAVFSLIWLRRYSIAIGSLPYFMI